MSPYLIKTGDLAQYLHHRPIVRTPKGEGKMVQIDLDQDLGYPIGVRIEDNSPGISKVCWFSPEQVNLICLPHEDPDKVVYFACLDFIP